MIILKILSKLIKALRSANSPNQLAWGFALGAIIGLTPLNSLHNLVIVVLLFILNVNISAAFLAWILYSMIAWIFDPLFHSIGYVILVELSSIKPLWTSLYNAPISPLTRFYNTVVMGSFLISLVLLIPNYLGFKWFVRKYRESWNQKIEKWKIVKVLKGSKAVKLYFKIRKLEG